MKIYSPGLSGCLPEEQRFYEADVHDVNVHYSVVSTIHNRKISLWKRKNLQIYMYM